MTPTIDTSNMSAEQKAIIASLSKILDARDEALKTGNADALKKATDALTEHNASIITLSKDRDEQKKLNQGYESEIAKLKQYSAMRPAGGDMNPEAMKSFAERLLTSKEWKEQAWSGRIKQQFSLRGSIRKANTITEGGANASGLVIAPRGLGVFPEAQNQPPLRMRDLLTQIPLTETNSIEYQIETWNYAADYQVLEGDKKAQGDVTYTDHTASAKTIAWFVKVSRQMLADVPYMMTNIEDNLIYGVLKKEDLEILQGNNAAGHLWGLLPQATALPADYIPDISNKADELMSAIAYLAGKGYVVDSIVMNPLDWAGLSIQKTPQGLYLLGGPPQSTAPTSLWGMSLTLTPTMPQGQFLVAALRGNAAIFDKEAVTVDVAYENEDDFVRNLVTIRAEERIALAVFRPQCLVKGPFIVTP